MDFDLTEDQAVLISAVASATSRFRDMTATDRLSYSSYSQALDEELVAGGFLDAALMEGMGPLDAALIAEQVAQLPYVVEVAASSLVLPHVGAALPRPLALLSAPLDKAQRFLPVARTGVLDHGDEVLLLDIDPANVEPVESIYAYPYGRFRTLPDLSAARRLDPEAVGPFKVWRKVALAVELLGSIRAALDFTVAYVKERRMFGKALGTYQVVHHRLAECEQIASGLRLLTMKAAWTGSAFDADLAVCYGQQHIKKLMFDLHQFNGAMGLTQEHLLHFWTFRIRALQSELGGANGAALSLADQQWGVA